MDLLRDLPLAKLRGCGGLFGQEVQEKLGITTAGELAAVPFARLERLWGTEKALWLQRLAHGVDSVDGGITPRMIPKSISCGKTFRGQNSLSSANLNAIRFWLGELGKEVEERAEEDKRTNRRIPQLLTVAFDFCLEEERDRVSRSCPLRRGCQAAVIADDAMALIKKWAADKPPCWTIHSMSIQVSNFQDAPKASITRFFGAAQAASPNAAARQAASSTAAQAASPTAAAAKAAPSTAAQTASPTATAAKAASSTAAQAASPTAAVAKAASPTAAAAKAASFTAAQAASPTAAAAKATPSTAAQATSPTAAAAKAAPSTAAQAASPPAAPAAASITRPFSAAQQPGSSTSAPLVSCIPEQASCATRVGAAPHGTHLHQAAPAGVQHAGSGCTDAVIPTAAGELQLKELLGTFLHQAGPAGGQHAGGGCTDAVPTDSRKLQLEQGHNLKQEVLTAGAHDQGTHRHHGFHPPPPHHLHPPEPQQQQQQQQQPQPGLPGAPSHPCIEEGNEQHHQQQQQRSSSPPSARPQQQGWKRIRGAEVDCQVLAELPPDLQAEIQSSLIVPASRGSSGSQYSGVSSKRGRGRGRGRATATDGGGGRGKAPSKDLLSFFRAAQPPRAHEQT
ncbi:hypothetical protein DUNSADRAFT_10594 [Dunaliella salina]|uniref:DNA polymerase Y-family little finger domain-containing protein n=1 Tax=Dunaliella salina TaxID=3046 RepID=A0ABQ7GEY8_DUNSA|nr:hypothetical protein DUNSADRAFT_10594 [Dunaliella salina]|eukprot:KAF5833180.1 hypothetical protein DUNSADRAFT_10594 [Dunaliella salina]